MTFADTPVDARDGLAARGALVRAYGKLNLTLEVVGRRPDGYHDLRSLVVGVDWCDDVFGMSWDPGGAEPGAGDPVHDDPEASPGLESGGSPRLASGVSPGLAFGVSPRLTSGVSPGLGSGVTPASAEEVPHPGGGHVAGGHQEAWHRFGTGVAYRGDDPALDGPDNLVVLAARALFERYAPPRGVRLELTKRLPVGAGLGGGSSDAAATLVLCNRLWGLGLSTGNLARIGAELGSDVPLFFAMPRAVIRGRGERVEPMEPIWAGWAVLVRVDTRVSTADVYSAWRPADRHPGAERALRGAMDARTASELNRWTYNDLEAAVFRVAPDVRDVAGRLARALPGRRPRVTGAGSVLYLLEDDGDAARATAAGIDDRAVGAAVHVVRVLNAPALEVHEGVSWKSPT